MSKVATRIIEGVIPPGGWHFMQPMLHGQPDHQITSWDLEHLIQAVIDWRVDNGRPVGDVLAEVEAYICGYAPHQCHNTPGASVVVSVAVTPDRTEVGQTFVDRMVQWLELQINELDRNAIVLEYEANRRAEICSRCPKNVRWLTSCGKCNDNVDRLSTIIRNGATLDRERRLMACGILNHHNPTAVFLRLERVGSSPDCPDNCWAKREG